MYAVAGGLNGYGVHPNRNRRSIAKWDIYRNKQQHIMPKIRTTFKQRLTNQWRTNIMTVRELEDCLREYDLDQGVVIETGGTLHHIQSIFLEVIAQIPDTPDAKKTHEYKEMCVVRVGATVSDMFFTLPPPLLPNSSAIKKHKWLQNKPTESKYYEEANCLHRTN
jgi:hypothetical protein